MNTYFLRLPRAIYANDLGKISEMLSENKLSADGSMPGTKVLTSCIIFTSESTSASQRRSLEKASELLSEHMLQRDREDLLKKIVWRR